MKCLVINLDRSRDRLAHVTAEFARIGVAFERVAAIDARERPDIDGMPQRTAYTNRSELTGGEIACLLSHRACWTMIVEGNDPYCAIFEDDILFSVNAGPLLTDAGWIPAGADIVKLETTFEKTTIGGKRIPAGPIFSLSRLHKIHLGSAGYIISRQAARDLVNESAEIVAVVDDLIFNPDFNTPARKTIYQLDPALCAQDQILGDKSVGLPSTLHQERAPRFLSTAKVTKRDKRISERLAAEFRRMGRQMHDIYRGRKKKVIPFHYHGELVFPPHTHRRKNTL